jgi:hypothetical protein
VRVYSNATPHSAPAGLCVLATPRHTRGTTPTNVIEWIVEFSSISHLSVRRCSWQTRRFNSAATDTVEFDERATLTWRRRNADSVDLLYSDKEKDDNKGLQGPAHVFFNIFKAVVGAGVIGFSALNRRLANRLFRLTGCVQEWRHLGLDRWHVPDSVVERLHDEDSRSHQGAHETPRIVPRVGARCDAAVVEEVYASADLRDDCVHGHGRLHGVLDLLRQAVARLVRRRHLPAHCHHGDGVGRVLVGALVERHRVLQSARRHRVAAGDGGGRLLRLRDVHHQAARLLPCSQLGNVAFVLWTCGLLVIRLRCVGGMSEVAVAQVRYSHARVAAAKRDAKAVAVRASVVIQSHCRTHIKHGESTRVRPAW